MFCCVGKAEILILAKASCWMCSHSAKDRLELIQVFQRRLKYARNIFIFLLPSELT